MNLKYSNQMEVYKRCESNGGSPILMIELSLDEANMIRYALSRTACKGEPLDKSLELEDKMYRLLDLENPV